MRTKARYRLTNRLNQLAVAVMFSVLGMMSLVPSHAYAFSGGSGTSGDPYQITTAAELASMSSYLGSGNSGKYFKVMNNIDLNVSPYNSGTGWTPIGISSNYFYAHFDGNFKTISNLYINNSSASYVGLFGAIGNTGNIQNVILSNPNVNGNVEVGSLAGVSYGTITKAGVTGGSVTGIQRVGGLVGSDFGAMTYDYSSDSVYFNPTSSPTCCAGGLIGESYSGGTINNSYSRSSVTITYNVYDQGAVGGLYGNDYSSGAKSNLYSTGAITMVSGSFPSSTGGLAGSNYTSTTGSYWDTQTSGWATSSGGAGVVGKTTSQMKTQSTYSGWDFTNTWAIDANGIINDGYPYLQWSSTNSSPNTPSSLGGLSVTNGIVSNATQPLFTFSLSDPNGSDTVKYEIQIDNNSDFGSPEVDYTSGLAAQGSVSFTVGQTSGGGTYVTGSSGQTLNDGSYYWRVKAIDNSAASSGYAVANSGNAAFIIDATSPTKPGTPATVSPTSGASPVWAWTASTDSGSGLSTTAYTVQWSQSVNFSSGVLASTSTTNSFTQPSSLSDGVWYFRVLATDNTGNNSSYSSAGSVVIDTTPPTIPGTPSSSSSSSSTPTWTWTPSIDSGVGLATVAYSVQWSKDSSFINNVSSNTSTGSSFTQPNSLSNGTWYFRIKASDILGSTSAYSSAGSFTVSVLAEDKPTITTPALVDTPAATTADLPQNDTIINTDPIVLTLLNDFPAYTSGAGKPLDLGTNQTVKFRVDAETHTAVVQEVGPDFALLVLHSTPIVARLAVGQTSQYDVNHDGTNDISITLASVSNGVAHLVFAQIKQVGNANTQASANTYSSRWLVLSLVVCLVALFVVSRFRRSHS